MKKLILLAICLAFVLGFTAFGKISPTVYADNEQETEDVLTAVLKQGDVNENVKTMQRKLKNWGYYTGAIDGIFGANTLKAVKLFQKRNGLVADGIVGAKTLSALGMSLATSTTNSSYSNSDVNLLAHLIYGEARGEPYTGQVAVGAVVLNRVKSASFPNTISSVIYQSYAFTAVNDGQINLTPNETAIKAAKDAMNGWDPTYGAIYYYNPKTATSAWIFSRKTTITIGNHVFAK